MAWEALSPDPCLSPYKLDFIWLSQVYDSVRPVDKESSSGRRSDPKTIELVHQNIAVERVRDDDDILELDEDVIEHFINDKSNTEKITRKLEIDLVARIRKHDKNGKFQKLSKRLEDLRERHEQGLIDTASSSSRCSLTSPKRREPPKRKSCPRKKEDKGKAALTELFNGIKNGDTPIIVENIVNGVDEIVKITRFDGWQATTTGVKEVKKQLRAILWMRYKLKESGPIQQSLFVYRALLLTELVKIGGSTRIAKSEPSLQDKRSNRIIRKPGSAPKYYSREYQRLRAQYSVRTI